MTKKYQFPLMKTEDLFEYLNGAKIFTLLDLMAGYWQAPINERAAELSTFTGPNGSYKPKVLMMGLTNAVAWFQRQMTKVLGDYIGKFVYLHIDDVLIFSKNEKEHIKHLQLVLQCLQKHNIVCKFQKAVIARKSLNVLGHVVSEESTDTQRKSEINY